MKRYLLLLILNLNLKFGSKCLLNEEFEWLLESINHYEKDAGKLLH